MLLEFQGRRTGRTIKVPVNMNLVDGVVMAFTPAPWRYNFIGGAPATVTYRGQPHRSRGTLVQMHPKRWGLPCAGHSTPADPHSAWEFGRPRGTNRPRPNSPHWDPRSARQRSGSS